MPLNFESGIWMAIVPKKSSQLESIIWNHATNVLSKIVFKIKRKTCNSTTQKSRISMETRDEIMNTMKEDLMFSIKKPKNFHKKFPPATFILAETLIFFHSKTFQKN